MWASERWLPVVVGGVTGGAGVPARWLLLLPTARFPTAQAAGCRLQHVQRCRGSGLSCLWLRYSGLGQQSFGSIHTYGCAFVQVLQIPSS